MVHASCHAPHLVSRDTPHAVTRLTLHVTYHTLLPDFTYPPASACSSRSQNLLSAPRFLGDVQAPASRFRRRSNHLPPQLKISIVCPVPLQLLPRRLLCSAAQPPELTSNRWCQYLGANCIALPTRGASSTASDGGDTGSGVETRLPLDWHLQLLQATSGCNIALQASAVLICRHRAGAGVSAIIGELPQRFTSSVSAVTSASEQKALGKFSAAAIALAGDAAVRDVLGP